MTNKKTPKYIEPPLISMTRRGKLGDEYSLRIPEKYKEGVPPNAAYYCMFIQRCLVYKPTDSFLFFCNEEINKAVLNVFTLFTDDICKLEHKAFMLGNNDDTTQDYDEYYALRRSFYHIYLLTNHVINDEDLILKIKKWFNEPRSEPISKETMICVIEFAISYYEKLKQFGL